MRINVDKMELIAAQQGLNCSGLAAKAQISRQTISTIRMRKTCSGGVMVRLADALGVDVTEILVQEG